MHGPSVPINPCSSFQDSAENKGYILHSESEAVAVQINTYRQASYI